MKEQIHLNVVNNSDDPEKPLIIHLLEGKAPEPPKDPKTVVLSGTLVSPLEFLRKRLSLIDQLRTHVVFSRSDLRITVVTNDNNYYQDSIEGSLKMDPLFKLFGINQEKWFKLPELAKLIKMNRTCFESRQDAEAIYEELTTFKATLNKVLEKTDDNRGNKTDITQQTVDSNLPESFKMKLPVFVGLPPEEFEVEVYIRAEDFSCQLISPDANDIVAKYRDSQIDSVLKEIKEIASNIAIIEE